MGGRWSSSDNNNNRFEYGRSNFKLIDIYEYIYNQRMARQIAHIYHISHISTQFNSTRTHSNSLTHLLTHLKDTWRNFYAVEPEDAHFPNLSHTHFTHATNSTHFATFTQRQQHQQHRVSTHKHLVVPSAHAHAHTGMSKRVSQQ
jgi:hypothetical protein